MAARDLARFSSRFSAHLPLPFGPRTPILPVGIVFSACRLPFVWLAGFKALAGFPRSTFPISAGDLQVVSAFRQP